MIDHFYEREENNITNYADHTTAYSCGTNISTVISELQDIFELQDISELQSYLLKECK